MHILVLLFGVILPLVLIAAIVSTWLKMGDVEAKQDDILRALARLEGRLANPPEPATATCIRCMGKAPAGAASCPHCGARLRPD